MKIPAFVQEGLGQARAALGGLAELAAMLPSSGRAEAVRAHLRRMGRGYILFTLGADAAIALVISLLSRAPASEIVGVVLALWLMRALFWAVRTLYSAVLFYAQGEKERLVSLFIRQLELGKFPPPASAETAPRAYLESLAANDSLDPTARIRAVLLVEHLGRIRGQAGIVQQFMAETAFAEALAHHARR